MRGITLERVLGNQSADNLLVIGVDENTMVHDYRTSSLYCSHRLRNTIKRDQPAAGAKTGQHLPAVATTAKRSIDIDSISLDVQRADSLPEQNRSVRTLAHNTKGREPGLTMAIVVSPGSQRKVLHACRQLVRPGLELLQLPIPGFLAPQLEMTALPNKHELLLQPRELAQRR